MRHARLLPATLLCASLTGMPLVAAGIFVLLGPIPAKAGPVPPRPPAPDVPPQSGPATYTIAVKDVNEGERLVFQVTRSGAPLPAQRLSWRVTGDGGAINGRQGGFIDFAPGRTRALVSIRTSENTIAEPDRSITVTLSGPVRFESRNATGRIFDDDASPGSPPTYEIAGAQANEGKRLNFRVTRSGASLPQQSLNWRLAGDVAAVGGPRSGVIAFADGERQAFVSILTIGNAVAEPARLVTVTLRGKAQIRPASAIGQILDDDAPTARARLFVNDAQAAEGQQMVFTITRAGNAANVTRVSYETGTGADAGDASPGTDFERRSGVAVFDVGETTQSVVITTHPRANVNGDRHIHLFLTGAPSNVEVGDGEGVGIISDSDELAEGPASFAIEDASASRGSPLTFTIRRVGPPVAVYSLAYAIVDNGIPVTIEGPIPRIPFAEGQMLARLPVNYSECSRSVSVTLSDPQPDAAITRASATATIVGALPANCGQPPPSFAITAKTASAIEGGTLAFVISRTGSTDRAQSVSYTVADESYCAPAGTIPARTVMLGRGQQALPIEIPLCNDSEAQGPRQLEVALRDPAGPAVLSSAVAIIEDDDGGWPWWIWILVGLTGLGLLGVALLAWPRLRELIWPAPEPGGD